jgi:glycosyltransferase involved in cell wall biosynthesis
VTDLRTEAAAQQTSSRDGQPLRILHIIHSLAPGGAEAVLIDLAAAAPTANLKLAVMPLVQGVDQRYLHALHALDVPVFGLDLPSRWDPRAVPRSLTMLKAWRPHIVHSHMQHADVVAALAARRLRVPMVSTLHALHEEPGAVFRAKRLVAAAARLSTAARTISVSDAQRRWYLNAFPRADARHVVTIHNGVADPRARPTDPAATAELRRLFGVPATAVMVVQIGMLRPGKGHTDLLTAVRMLSEHPAVHVVIIGDGPLRAQVEVAARDVADRVRFIGFRHDVPAILDSCDIVVQPSEFDALPTALIQALAAGKPAVATAVGGIPEIVTADEGVLISPRDPSALAAAIGALAADPQRRTRLGISARRRFERYFESRAWAAALQDLYAEIRAEVAK